MIARVQTLSSTLHVSPLTMFQASFHIIVIIIVLIVSFASVYPLPAGPFSSSQFSLLLPRLFLSVVFSPFFLRLLNGPLLPSNPARPLCHACLSLVFPRLVYPHFRASISIFAHPTLELNYTPEVERFCPISSRCRPAAMRVCPVSLFSLDRNDTTIHLSSWPRNFISATRADLLVTVHLFHFFSVPVPLSLFFFVSNNIMIISIRHNCVNRN